MKQSSHLRDKIFLQILKDEGFNEPTAEFKFHPKRKWRFDFAFIEQLIAIEIEGGLWQIGRHNRPVSMIKDMEKYNNAAVLGWKVLRFTPEQLTKKETIILIKNAFENEKINYIINEKLL